MKNTDIELLSAHRCFDGVQSFHRHQSSEIGLPMQFSMYTPPQVGKGE
jgi:S-formylglutathione hydrolase